MLLPVILSGGAGTRLWPLSRAAKPKQFLNLVDEISLFQKTVERALSYPDVLPPLVICNESHRFLVAEQLQAMGVKASAIILEPIGKNTAPAATLAALFAASNVRDAMLLIMPSDHVIMNVEAFQKVLSKACSVAQDGFLVTFGIRPTYPETGYGYIKTGKLLFSSDNIFQIEQFIEKPKVATAQIYLDSKEYYWNSGMFLFQASKWLEEINNFAPKILKVCKDTWQHINIDQDFYRLPREYFVQCPNDSIDYAVMEKETHAVVIPADIGWSDVGSWNALKKLGIADQAGNVIGGKTENIFTHQSKNCYVHAKSRLLALVGTCNLVVVETSDAVLVADNKALQEIKPLIDMLQKNNKTDVL